MYSIKGGRQPQSRADFLFAYWQFSLTVCILFIVLAVCFYFMMALKWFSNYCSSTHRGPHWLPVLNGCKRYPNLLPNDNLWQLFFSPQKTILSEIKWLMKVIKRSLLFTYVSEAQKPAVLTRASITPYDNTLKQGRMLELKRKKLINK